MELEEGELSESESYIIRASGVPLEFFENRDAAKKYFRRFGKVKLVMFKPKRRALVIEYANEDGMLNALEVAGEYNGHVFAVKRDTATVLKKKKAKDPDPDWTADPEVRAELEAMGAFGPSRSYDLRAEAMMVDHVERRKWKTSTASPKSTIKKSLGNKDILMGSDQADLWNIIKQQAVTIDDKYRILDARDKLIRIKMKKNVEISKASATVGTCPDMCPEKERLMRETQHQVALYEQAEGGKGMNPRLAVKQYSRSSADQEAPLPQELRPVAVLQMTMGYLMHRIMDLCDIPDVNLAEWYHFLWDRTRGIRKDITQQELCCQGAVELVEQCARFHIFCSARLVSEDPSVFDQKINTENLTKCLQTLKYMYHDLQLKGVSCFNEPEFRAYIILLNLNDGNFMWEVQQLKEDIQQSKEVKFALEVYSSLDKHNYVKFFKLVNSTTYLNACILMRYFIQVRISAVKTLLKSYSPRVSQASLPVSYLTKILGFENPESAIEFFESYGLYTDVERTRVVLDRPSFALPEYPYVLDRAINLVESKRRNSVGEVICGKQLPPKIFENHVPQNSFDPEGYLRHTPEADEPDAKKDEVPKQNIFVSKQSGRSSPTVFAKPAEASRSSPNIFKPSEHFRPKPSEANIFAHKKSEANVFAHRPSEANVFAHRPSESAERGSPNIFAPKPSALKPAQTTAIFAKKQSEQSIFGKPEEAVFGKAPKNIFGGEPAIPQTEAKPEKIAEETKQRRIEEEQERIRKRLEEEQKRIELEKKRLQEQQRVLEAQKAEALRKRLMEEEERRRQRKKQEMIEIQLTVKSLISDLVTRAEENVKQEKLAAISRRIYDRKLKRIVAKWRENSRRSRKRKAIDFNPVWISAKTVRESADELRISSQDLTLSGIKRYKRGQPCEIALKESVEICKIDLCDLTYKLLVKKHLELDMKLHQELFWKVTISVPNESELRHGLNHIEKVLEKCIQWKERNSTTVLIEQSKSSPTVTYCLEKQKGLVANSSRNDTNGFIFIANELNDDALKRILHNLRNYGSFVKVPLVLGLQHFDENSSTLQSLVKDGVVSDYLIIVDKFTSKNIINIVEEALIFLSTRVEKAPPLQMDTLRSFLLKYLCSDVWKRANSFAKWNSNYKNCLKSPNTVIYLYNEALDHLKKTLLNEACKKYARFPEIFKGFLRSEIPDALPCDYKYFPSFWDNPSYCAHVESVLNGLYLPNFLEDWPPTDQVQLELGVSKYCTQVFRDPQTSFYRIMSVLLRNIDPSVNFKDVGGVVWTDVVELLANEKLNETDFSLYGTGFVNKSIYNQLIVVYHVNTLSDYVRSDWFYINNPVIKHKISQLLSEEKEGEVIVEEDAFEDIDLDDVLEKLKRPSKQDVSKIKSEVTDCKKLLDDLEETIDIHKKILEKSSNLLKTVLERS